MEKLSYTFDGAAEASNIPQTKLRQAADDGLLTTFRIGRSVRISDWALKDFIKKLETREIAIERQRYGDSAA